MSKNSKELLAKLFIGAGGLAVLAGCLMIFTNLSHVYRLTGACNSSVACQTTLNGLNGSIRRAFVAMGIGLLFFGAGGIFLAYLENRLGRRKK